MEMNEQDPLMKAAKRRLQAALAIFLSGCIAIITGVAFIFWPAALIAGGVLAVIVGALFVNIPPNIMGRPPR